jgi:hypothetical protein
MNPGKRTHSDIKTLLAAQGFAGYGHWAGWGLFLRALLFVARPSGCQPVSSFNWFIPLNTDESLQSADSDSQTLQISESGKMTLFQDDDF